MPCMYNATMRNLLYFFTPYSFTPLFPTPLLLKNILSPVIYMPKFTDRQNIITFAALYN